MSDALNIAVNGLNNTSLQIAKTASSIVNASSSSGNSALAGNLVALATEKTSYEAEAKVAGVVQKTNQALLDIFA
jgi:hypothetical protein